MSIQAIETHYKGYRFRSRLEARWAVFFDTLGIQWEYEPEGFVLDDGSCYLPDFWLPTLSRFIEIKGTTPTGDEYMKAQRLSKLHPVVIFVGLPGETFAWEFEGGYFTHGPTNCRITWRPEEQDFEYFCDEERTDWEEPNFLIRGPGHQAITAARSARFEHGERPA